jgi:Ca2+/Na+ antiporter
MHVEWPAVIVGFVLLVAGFLLARYRRFVAKENAAGQRFEIGRRSSTPAVVLTVGIFFLCFGLLTILVGIF